MFEGDSINTSSSSSIHNHSYLYVKVKSMINFVSFSVNLVFLLLYFPYFFIYLNFIVLLNYVR